MEKRNNLRRRTLKGVRVSFNDKFCAVECVLRNISECGALLEFTDGALIPDKFVMHNEMDGYQVNCQIMRRIGNSVGVEFTSQKQQIKAIRKQIIDTPRYTKQPSRSQLR